MKGLVIFEATVKGIVGLVDKLRAWPIERWADPHAGPVPSQIRW